MYANPVVQRIMQGAAQASEAMSDISFMSPTQPRTPSAIFAVPSTQETEVRGTIDVAEIFNNTILSDSFQEAKAKLVFTEQERRNGDNGDETSYAEDNSILKTWI